VSIYTIDPLSDNRWNDLVARHPRATSFHERGWLKALARTYDYHPVVLTTNAGGEPLNNGIVFCRISSWVTGTRLVSLPFADHCDPLLNGPDGSLEMMHWLRAECDRGRWRYVEFRPLPGEQDPNSDLHPASSYCFHELDLKPTLDQIIDKLHKNSFRRKIKRAEKEGLAYEVGNSELLVNEFYDLLLITRKRHQLLPQPITWFKNLAECMPGKLQIRLARKDGVSIAAMLTLRHQSCVVYKYGCSDASRHNLGGMPFLFWNLVKESKTTGAEKIDLGRSDLNNEGLITFKNRLGATSRLLTYYRYPNNGMDNRSTWEFRGLRDVLFNLPNSVLSAAGRVLYKHVG
jgi:hypothetical protein